MTPDHVPLTDADLISNEPLRALSPAGRIPDRDDRFRHRILAKRVAELIAVPGRNVNIAVNAPWGAGKSTFYTLLKEELADHTGPSGEPRFTIIDFDAWQLADNNFEANFLATVAAKVPRSPRNIEQRLFRANRTVNLPFGLDVQHPGWRKVLITAVVLVALTVILLVPLLQTFAETATPPAGWDWNSIWVVWWPLFIVKLSGWLGVAAGGTLLFAVITLATNIWTVSVQESGPAHVTQFRQLFTAILKRARTTQVILIDELDRCHPDGVMRTLEGLRRFLGHEKCVFVVAFDRESVTEAITGTLKRPVPDRVDRPYYSTAGEYLDKIFTYQVALPPQPSSAFRSYARALIETKSNGVWGQLRSHSSEQLDRITSILSPPHLTSPRRTKVILNDFAINARTVESFNGSWLDRSDEIAVITVLQTEFPNFYADVEHHPNLLMFVGRRSESDPGESIRRLVDRYRADNPQLDTIVSRPPTDAAHTQNRQLERFLEKLRDMQVPLPRADLIQLGTGQHMLSFEDPAVYAAAEAATEVPREETLSILRAATPADRAEAIRTMLATIEGETSAEATTLRIIVGTLLTEHDPVDHHQLYNEIDGAWERVLATNALETLPAVPIAGFTRTLAPRKDRGWAARYLQRTLPRPALAANAIHTIAETGSDDAVTGNRAALLDAAIDLTPSAFGPLIALLHRFERLSEPAPPDRAASTIAGALTGLHVEPEEQSRMTDEDREAQLTAATTALTELLRSLPESSTIRPWVYAVFRYRAQMHPDAIDDYTNLLDQDIATGRLNAAVEEALRGISATAPLPYSEAVAERIISSSPNPKLVKPALLMLLKLATATNNARGTFMGALGHLADFSTENTDVDVISVRKAVAHVYNEPVKERARFDTLLRVARLLAQLPRLRKLSSKLVSEMVMTAVIDAQDGEDLLHVLHGLRSERPATLHRVSDGLLAQLPGSHGTRKWVIQTLLCAQIRLQQLHRPVTPVPAAAIEPYLSTTNDRIAKHAWLQTGPPATDVLRVVEATDLHTVPADVWKLYAAHSTVQDRSTLWVEAAQTATTRAVLEAIASHTLNEEAITHAAEQVLAATNSDQRHATVRTFETLPVDPRTAAAILPALIRWAKQPVNADATMVERLLLHYRSAFTPADMTKLRAVLPGWFKTVKHRLPKVSEARLTNFGYLKNGQRRRK